MKSHLRRVALAVALCLALAPAPASATTSQPAIDAAVAASIPYFQGLQDSTTGLYVTGGTSPSMDWVNSALAAAGEAAADQTSGASPDARAAYIAQWGSPSFPAANVVTEYERAALNAYAAGIDPARVSKTQNLIAGVTGMYLPANPGYYGVLNNFNGTIFALLTFNEVGETTTGDVRVPDSVRDELVDVIRRNQHNDGGWDWPKAEGIPARLAATSDIDMTGSALAALCGAGVTTSDPDVAAGIAFLSGKLLDGSGGFDYFWGAPNVNSNGWAVQGLNTCGVDPQGVGFTTTSGHTPIDFLVAQQLGGGGFRYSASGSTPNAYGSVDAVRALAGAGFTAEPPTPSSGPKWVADSGFDTSPSVSGRLALIVDDGSGTLKVCRVSVSPQATTTTLGAVLDEALTGTAPANCVTGVAPAAPSTGTVEQVNGVPTTPTPNKWKLSIDGATETNASRSDTIELGDTISLRYVP